MPFHSKIAPLSLIIVLRYSSRHLFPSGARVRFEQNRQLPVVRLCVVGFPVFGPSGLPRGAGFSSCPVSVHDKSNCESRWLVAKGMAKRKKSQRKELTNKPQTICEEVSLSSPPSTIGNDNKTKLWDIETIVAAQNTFAKRSLRRVPFTETQPTNTSIERNESTVSALSRSESISQPVTADCWIGIESRLAVEKEKCKDVGNDHTGDTRNIFTCWRT